MLAVTTSTEHFMAIIALLTFILAAASVLVRLLWAALTIGREQIEATHANTRAIGDLSRRVSSLERRQAR